MNREPIGVIGICGSFAISAAKIDPRFKAIATMSMYDMGEVTHTGLGKYQSLVQRQAILAKAAKQRNLEFQGERLQYTNGSHHKLAVNPIADELYDFYRTKCGEFTPTGADSQITAHPTLSSNVKFMNFYPFNDIETISPHPLLFITGE